VFEDLKESRFWHFGFPAYEGITTEEVAKSRNAMGPTTIAFK
jgi:hypothetical protein